MKATIVLTLLVLCLYGCGHYLIYGNLTSSCIYTEEDLPIPQVLATGELQTLRQATQLVGHDAEQGCLVSLEDQRQITVSLYDRYLARGRNVQSLLSGTQFHLIGIKAITKHGLATMDSGPGPIYYLMLIDESGQKYYVAIEELSTDMPFLKLTNGTDSYTLDSTMFRDRSKYPPAFKFDPMAK